MRTFIVSTMLISLFVAGIGQSNNRIQMAFPFLLENTHPQSVGMGEIGVVSSSIYYATGLQQNPALLSRNSRVAGGRTSHFAWLPAFGIRNLTVTEIGGYYSLSKKHTLGYFGRKFNYGLGFYGNVLMETAPSEMSHSLRYGISVSENLSLGIGLTYIYSDFEGNFTRSSSPVWHMAGDIGIHYKRDFSLGDNEKLQWNLGGSITNIGPKVSFISTTARTNFLPTNLQLGTLLGYYKSPGKGIRLGIEIAYQAAKLLVPTEGFRSDASAVEGIFSSFTDAPGGFSEEMQEIVHQAGIEVRTQRQSTFMSALRIGTLLEADSKGGRKYMTFGSGVGLYGFRFDIAYLLPFRRNQPQQNAFRFGLACNFDLDQEGLRLMEW